jgi:nucleoid-associated protein YgaU
MSRYNRRVKIRIDGKKHSQYKKMLKDRGRNFIDLYGTPKLAHITEKQVVSLQLVGHTWRSGDRYYRLAHRYYGDSELWWIIAWYNRKPTEAHLKVGETITIPLPLDKVLAYLKV